MQWAVGDTGLYLALGHRPIFMLLNHCWGRQEILSTAEDFLGSAVFGFLMWILSSL